MTEDPGTPVQPLATAAIDITTAHGIDSLFDSRLRDPWAEDSFANFVDVAVNHPRVLLPLPSDRALAELHILPRCVRTAYNAKLIGFQKGVFAASVTLPNTVLRQQYGIFSHWCRRQPLDIVEWLYFQRNTPEILAQNSRQATPSVLSFWPRKPSDRLDAFLGVSDVDLRYAFDVFARTLQYHVILHGDGAYYFRHPFRNPALPTKDADHFLRGTSWGVAFLTAIQQGLMPAEHEPVFELVAKVKEHNKNTTWYHMAGDTHERRVEAMHDVAAAAKLPATFIDSVLRTLRISLGIGAAAATLFNRPVGILMTTLLAFGREWKGRIPANLADVKALQGAVERPYLPRLYGRAGAA